MVENDVRALPVHLANDAQPFTRPAPCESPRRGALCPLVRVARVGYAVLQLDLPSPAREPPNMAEWYYARNNQRLGPVSMEQLKQLSSRGELSPTDLVWKDGMANWAAANTVTGLFTAAAPAPMAPRQAAVVAPAPGVTDDDVVQLMPGSGGPSFMDDVMLIATRAVSPDLDTMKVSEAEKTELSKAGITGETAQRYLAWRRSLLWVALVPLAFSGVSLVIDSAIYTVAGDALKGPGILLEVLRLLTLLGLPALAALAALTWNKPQLSTLLATLGLLVCYGLPILIQILPPGWWLAGGAGPFAKHGIGDPWPMLLGMAVSLMSVPPGLLRGSARVRTLLPEAAVTGLPVVGLAVMSALFFFGMLVGDPHFTTPVLGLFFMLCMTLAPVCYVVGAKTFLRPISSASDRGAVALWQWIYHGLCGGAFLFAVVQMLTTDATLGAYGFWIAFLLFLDFLGRSLFASVVAAHFILSSTRTALVTQSQLAKTDQGATLDRRLAELEPVVGKMRAGEPVASVPG